MSLRGKLGVTIMAMAAWQGHAQTYKNLPPTRGIMDWSLINGNTNMNVNYTVNQKPGYNLAYAVVKLSPFEAIVDEGTFFPGDPPDVVLSPLPPDFFFTIDTVGIFHNNVNGSGIPDTAYLEIRNSETRALIKRTHKVFTDVESNSFFYEQFYPVNYTTKPGETVSLYFRVVLGDTVNNSISIVADCVMDGFEDGFYTNTKSKYPTSSYKYNFNPSFEAGWVVNSSFKSSNGAYWGAQDWKMRAYITFGNPNQPDRVISRKQAPGGLRFDQASLGALARGAAPLRFHADQAGPVSFTLLAPSGKAAAPSREVRARAGENAFAADLKGVPPGIYFARLQSGRSSAVGRILIAP